MTRRPDIGKLRHRVTLYTVTQVDDGAGGFNRTDPSVGTELGTFWADVTPVRMREVQRAQQFEESITHKVLVRYNSSFTDGMIVRHDGRDMYIITIVDPDQMKEWMHLMVREGGPQ